MSRLELQILLSKLISGYLKPTAGAPEFEGWAAELDGAAEEAAAEHEEMKKNWAAELDGAAEEAAAEHEEQKHAVPNSLVLLLMDNKDVLGITDSQAWAVSDALEMDNALNLLYLSDVTDLKVLDFLSTKQIEALWQLVEHVKTNPAFWRELERSTRRNVHHCL